MAPNGGRKASQSTWDCVLSSLIFHEIRTMMTITGTVCTENPIRVDGAMESPKLVE